MSHHHCDGSHDHDETPETGIEYSLYEKIDKDNLECLNEAQDGSAKKIFKPWEERLNFDVVKVMFTMVCVCLYGFFLQCVESDADEELLFNIPFTGNVKLKGIMIIGNDDETFPSKMRL